MRVPWCHWWFFGWITLCVLSTESRISAQIRSWQKWPPHFSCLLPFGHRMLPERICLEKSETMVNTNGDPPNAQKIRFRKYGNILPIDQKKTSRWTEIQNHQKQLETLCTFGSNIEPENGWCIQYFMTNFCQNNPFTPIESMLQAPEAIIESPMIQTKQHQDADQAKGLGHGNVVFSKFWEKCTKKNCQNANRFWGTGAYLFWLLQSLWNNDSIIFRGVPLTPSQGREHAAALTHVFVLYTANMGKQLMQLCGIFFVNRMLMQFSPSRNGKQKSLGVKLIKP